ncbi:MAG TPA: hypothetical protein VFW85_01760 [Gaiellaceae bacterium]|nr:hypothetical protein [Gaiellaceae bacterium]
MRTIVASVAVCVCVLAVSAAAAPTPSAGPAVTGVLQQGGKLTATPGTWTAGTDVTYAYQWHRCDANGAHCTSIHGATKATYTEVAADVGKSLALNVTATDSTGATPAYAPLAGLVAAASNPLVAPAQPTISGHAAVGQALSVGTPQWSGAPTSTTYQWSHCNANGRICTAIPGATAQNYTVATTDLGATLLAAVTATAGTYTQTLLSLPTAAVVAAATGPTPGGRPSIGGTLRAGSRLVGRPGSWVGTGTITYAYQWYRCDSAASHCSSVHGATKPTYVTVAKDIGATVGITVHATDSTGTAIAYGSVSGIVQPSTATLAPTTQPVVTGTTKVGTKLIVKGGTWTVKPKTLTYTWKSCNPNGRICATIAAATTATYTPVAADVGHTLVAQVLAISGTAQAAVLSLASTVVVS